jgi:hypothetical protein
MKKWQQCMMAAILGSLGAAYGANADDSTITNSQPNTSADYSFYRTQELSIDLFGSGTLNEQTIDHISGDSVQHNGRLGLGAGANYFFTRYIGVGGDFYTENTEHIFVDSASGNLIGRLPIGDTGIAPYIFGGAGHEFYQVEQTFGQAGAGVEFRFAQHIGFFIDARYVFADRTDDYGVGRAGLRLSF